MPLVALGLFELKSCIYCKVFGFDFPCEAKVRQRVFVRAEDLRFIRKHGQFCQGGNHLFRRSLEQASAAAGKQGVTAKQPALFRCKIGNMATRVARNIQHFELEVWRIEPDSITFAYGVRDLRNGFIARTEYGNRIAAQQVGHAADMVSVMMSQ